MRFMLLVIPKGYENATPGTMPEAELVEQMTRYNREMAKAGVLLEGEGLHPPSNGARVSWSDGRPEVSEGISPATQEAVGGYWMIRVNSKAEAITWAKRAPFPDGDAIEIRQVQEMEDFPPDVQKAARD